MKRFSATCLPVACLLARLLGSFSHAAETIDLPAEVLRDKIRGGLLGQMLGNLNGLPHEMKYIAEPGNVSNYMPALPEGAWTDDDTDFEWVYIVEMQRANRSLLLPEQIAELWRARINRRIWCSNQYARQLMDLDLEPPLTGSVLLNPWASFNISGQFLCETFGLIAPAMPQTASRIGLNYTRVAIDGEPAQTTQLFDTMIATAFVKSDLEEILSAGLAALDADSEIARIVKDVQAWHREAPDDWRVARLRIKDKYSRYDGAMRDRNGYELNTAVTIAALLYGMGDFPVTLEHAFNFGWDCDNSAATVGTIMGVVRGYSWMLAQGWPIVDRYRNTTRDDMPMDETITRFADRLVDLAEKVILENGGARQLEGSHVAYRIRTEEPACVRTLSDPAEEASRLRAALREEIENQIVRGAADRARARAAYLAICLDLAPEFKARHAEAWQRAVTALSAHENVAQALFHHADVPAAPALQEKAIAAGLVRPPQRKPLW